MLQMFVGSLFATFSFALAFLVSLLSISLCLVVFSSKEMYRRPKKILKILDIQALIADVYEFISQKTRSLYLVNLRLSDFSGEL